ncbi:MAG TPA: aminoglycoside phosphotransferase family protein [Hanamia sp.]|nr:aminoglycoside phosphotransferase family protein [Hanamia sp.]
MLDVNNFGILKKYLTEKDIIEPNSPVLIQSLPGGVSNSVLKISCDRGQFVLKQALPKLKVTSEWVSDVARSNVEKQALKFLYGIIPGTTPALLYEDENNYLFIMECVPESSVTWKSLLLKQDCNASLAKKVGEILGRLHQNTHDLQEARELFGNKKYFYQLRIEPFFEFLKCKYPDLTMDIDRHIANCLERECSIVIGDYSPKNILVCDEQIVVIDFEVIHYGDSSFDLGFLTTHLLLKSLNAWEFRDSYYDILQATVDGYFSCIQFAKRADLEQQCVQQLAWILLARVDGKSPIAYISKEKDKQLIRYASRELLNNNMTTYKEVIEFFNLKMKQ